MQDPALARARLHFAIPDTGSHACMLNLASQLVMHDAARRRRHRARDHGGVARAGRVVSPRGRVHGDRYGECRVYAEGDTPLATLSHTFATPPGADRHPRRVAVRVRHRRGVPMKRFMIAMLLAGRTTGMPEPMGPSDAGD
jgi:hypothetical protein